MYMYVCTMHISGAIICIYILGDYLWLGMSEIKKNKKK